MSVPVVLTCLNIIFISVFGGVLLPRLKVAVTILISALLFYAAIAYGVVFDHSMIQNVLETDSGEAFSYLNLSFIGLFILLALVPVFGVFSQTIRGNFSTRVTKLFKINLVSIVCIVLVASFLYKDYVAVGRNNKGLTLALIPYAFYTAGYKYLCDTYLFPPLPYRMLDSNPQISASNFTVPRTVVMVVGETARAANFSSNGYNRHTTPSIVAAGAVSFDNVTSCGTETAISVPCMFSRLNREKYDARVASSQDNVLDIISRAGEAVKWIDNNSSCKGVCTRIDTLEFDPAISKASRLTAKPSAH